MKARARKLKAIALAVVVLVGGLPAAQVEAVSWPIAVISAYEWGPQMRPDSAYWCGYSYSGTYGSGRCQ